MTDQKPHPGPTLRERIATILSAPGIIEGPADYVQGVADDLAGVLVDAGVTIASWQYGVHYTVPEGGFTISAHDPMPEQTPATHRRAREGEWERLPEGETHEADTLVLWAGDLP